MFLSSVMFLIAEYMTVNLANRTFLQFLIENGDEFLAEPALKSPLSTPMTSPRLSSPQMTEMAPLPMHSVQTESTLPRINDIMGDSDEKVTETLEVSVASQRVLKLAGFSDASKAPPQVYRRVDQLLDFIDFIEETTGDAADEQVEKEDEEIDGAANEAPVIQVEQVQDLKSNNVAIDEPLKDAKSKYIALEKAPASLLKAAGAQHRRKSSSSVMTFESKLTTLEVQLLIMLDNTQGPSRFGNDNNYSG